MAVTEIEVELSWQESRSNLFFFLTGNEIEVGFLTGIEIEVSCLTGTEIKIGCLTEIEIADRS